jgi:hypothetical protein
MVGVVELTPTLGVASRYVPQYLPPAIIIS